jgi:hypothetical protein
MEQAPAVNGTRPRGRFVPDFPTFTTSAGYTVHVRKLSPDTRELLVAAAQAELRDDEPAIPTQRVPTGPGTEADFPAPDDPAYKQAKAAWDARVRQLAANKMLALLANYAVVDETDEEAVKELREMYKAQGVALPEKETDRLVWLWRVVAPTSDDQIGLLAFAIGAAIPTKEAIEAQKATFRRDVPGPGHLEAADTQE